MLLCITTPLRFMPGISLPKITRYSLVLVGLFATISLSDVLNFNVIFTKRGL